jgi:anti-anti-sigma factor
MESMRVASPGVAACRLSRESATLGPVPNVYRTEGAMTGILKLCPKRAHTVQVEGPLQMPLSRSLRHDVHALLRRGERRIELDLAAVSKIDAAGIGELIRTFNMATATNGALRIVNATAWVREVLERAHLFDVLTGERDVEQRLA